MPAPNGSDSERLMAEIEAFLRTGKGPPAAPEPRSSKRATTRPYDAGESDPGPAERAGRGGSGRPGGRGGHRRAGNRPWRGLTFTSGSPWSRWRHRRGQLPAGPPQWTPLRAILLVAFLVGLLLIPVVWPQSHGGGNTGGADHASSAPAAAGYSFLKVNGSGSPVRWNPCQAIPYQLDLAAAPASAQADITAAIASVSQATGITFDYQGTTNQLPTGQIPVGAGAAESPVVIAWATPEQSRSISLPVDLSGGSGSGTGSGTGSPPVAVGSLARTVLIASTDQVSGRSVYVSGSIVISAAASHLPSGFVPGGDGILVLHELGRLLGLTDQPAGGEVMNSQVLTSGVNGLGPGDRAGLARLGTASGCLTPPANGTLETVS